jgi:SOS-response transcriptional repressor LexA
MGWTQQYTSALAGKNPSKNIGDKTARLIEIEFRAPRDWLDSTNHREWIDEGLVTEHSSISLDKFRPGKQELPLLSTIEDITKWINRSLNQTADIIYFPVLPMMQLSNNAYAIKETTDMMPPMKPGDIYYVDPEAKPNSGDWCVFSINNTPVIGELEKSFRGSRLKFHNEQDAPVDIALADCRGVIKTKMLGEFFSSFQ